MMFVLSGRALCFLLLEMVNPVKALRRSLELGKQARAATKEEPLKVVNLTVLVNREKFDKLLSIPEVREAVEAAELLQKQGALPLCHACGNVRDVL